MKENFLKLENYIILKKSFLYTFVLGMIAHGYCFLNLLLSHDSLHGLYASSKWEKVDLGRIFFSSYISLTRGRFVLPWLIGIFALCWVALTVFLLAKIFDVQSSIIIGLFAGICVTNPTVYALAATFIHDLDADLFALLLSVLTVFLWKKATETEKLASKCQLIMLGVISSSISLGIYQSYISVTIALIMIICIKDTLEKQSCLTVFKKGVLGIACILISGGVYFLELKCFSTLSGISPLDNTKYNGLGNISATFFGNFVTKILGVYKSFLETFKDLILTSNPEKLMLVVQAIIVVCVGIAVLILLKKVQWENRVLIIVLGCLLPFGMNATYLLSNGTMHVLMQYASWFVYLFAVLLVVWIERYDKNSCKISKIVQLVLLITVCFTVLENIQTANTIYVKKELEYQTTLSYMTRVADRMEEQEDYVPGETPVIFVGNLVMGNSKYGFERYTAITGVETTSSITYYDTLEDYFEYVLGRPLHLRNNNGEVSQDVIKEMNSFPKKDSVIMQDGILIVKLN